MKPQKLLPHSLWQDNCIHLWTHLIEAFRAELVHRDLFDMAVGPFMKQRQIRQGTLEEVTHKHFAQRFQTSAGRVEFVVLDPNGKFDITSTLLRASLAGGVVALLDAPCGCGGGLFGLLTTLAELRAVAATPRLPLDVKVLAADICPRSREIHESLLERMTATLIEYGIRISCRYEHWDVMHRLSTADLMRQFALIYPDVDDIVILVSAFSDFAEGKQDRTARVLEALDDVVKYTHHMKPAIAWIEPASNDATAFIKKVLSNIFSLLRIENKNLPSGTSDTAKLKHPLKNELINVRAEVLPIDRLGLKS